MMKQSIYILFMLLLSLGRSYAQDSFTAKRNSPGYFESTVRHMFKVNHWEEGKRVLDEGLSRYPYLTTLNELAGLYFYKQKEYDIARYHLILSLRDNPKNGEAKQLLISVEEVTGNYSSAICYINELLEVTPYDKPLWRKKIALYRMQHNSAEADRLLRRLLQVYPQDSLLQNDLCYALELNYKENLKEGDRSKAIASLQELISYAPTHEAYYLALSNLYLQQEDYGDAIRTLSVGEIALPKSEEILLKKASVMAGNQQYSKAIDYLKEKSRLHNSSKIASLTSAILLEKARYEKENDPYLLYGRIYQTTGSYESLQYLINESVLRGYNEEALYYIGIAKKRGLTDAKLLYKEYQVYKRVGNNPKALLLLESLQQLDPKNSDIIYELSLLKLKQVADLMAEGNYLDAIAASQFIIEHCSDNEIRESALDRLYRCFIETKRYDEALSMLDREAKERNTPLLLEKRSFIYNKQGKTAEGLRILYEAIVHGDENLYTKQLIAAYEELAIPYLKSLVSEGALYDAYDVSTALLQVSPSSLEALQYAINLTSALKYREEYERYVALALTQYPTNAFFIVKQASIYNEKNNPQGAIELLTPTVKRLPGSTVVVNAFSDSCEKQAFLFLKENKVQEALDITNSALIYDERNPSLLYTKGEVYARLNQYDSAYYYQKNYIPTLYEVPRFSNHLDGLAARSMKNEAGVEYLQTRSGEADLISSVATAYYMRRNRRNSYTGRIYFIGRDSYSADTTEIPILGGMALQFQGEWLHRFNNRWEMMLGGAVGGKYFPKMMLQAQLQRNFKRDLSIDLHASYRSVSIYHKRLEWNSEKLNSDTNEMGLWESVGWNEVHQNLWNAGIGLSKIVEDFRINGKIDVVHFSSKLYFSTQLQAKYYFLNDAHSHLFAFANVGTAPEVSVIDYAMPNSFEKLSTIVGCGANLLLSPNFLIGVTGFWNTFYSKRLSERVGRQNNYTDYYETTYKNLYNIEAHAIVYF